MHILQQPIRLSEHLFLVYYEHPHQNSANVYLVAGSETTLIDCGNRTSIGALEQNLNQIGFKLSDIKQVIATHGDADHTQGFVEFAMRATNAALLIHHDDWLAVINGDVVLTKAYLYNQAPVPLPVERCIPLSGTQQIPVGDGALLFVHTPGHSAGSSSLVSWIDGQQWIFVGDTVDGAMASPDVVGITTWAESFANWQRSLSLLSNLEFDWVLTGHDDKPLSRAQFDCRVKRFGQMLNPWFLLAEDEDNDDIPRWPSSLISSPPPILVAAK